MCIKACRLCNSAVLVTSDLPSVRSCSPGRALPAALSAASSRLVKPFLPYQHAPAHTKAVKVLILTFLKLILVKALCGDNTPKLYRAAPVSTPESK